MSDESTTPPREPAVPDFSADADHEHSEPQATGEFEPYVVGTCKFPGCDRPVWKRAERGRAPQYCDDPNHNAQRYARVTEVAKSNERPVLRVAKNDATDGPATTTGGDTASDEDRESNHPVSEGKRDFAALVDQLTQAVDVVAEVLPQARDLLDLVSAADSADREVTAIKAAADARIQAADARAADADGRAAEAEAAQATAAADADRQRRVAEQALAEAEEARQAAERARIDAEEAIARAQSDAEQLVSAARKDADDARAAQAAADEARIRAESEAAAVSRTADENRRTIETLRKQLDDTHREYREAERERARDQRADREQLVAMYEARLAERDAQLSRYIDHGTP